MTGKQTLLCLALIALCFQSARAVIGVDISQLSDSFSCLKSSGMSFVIVRAYLSYGAIDSNAVTNLSRAKSAGLITDIYHFPCLKVSAATQAQAVISGISKSLYGTVWIDVETNPSSGCGWTSNIDTNCSFLESLVNYYKEKGILVGIYGSKYQWQTIFGAAGNCAHFTSLPVWYAHYDGVASFSDWSTYAFGGWSKPSIKQYKGDITLCSTGVDENYY